MTPSSAPTTTGTDTSSRPPPPHVVEECRGLLKLMSDGTVIRSGDPLLPFSFPDDGSVEWRDLLFDPTHGLNLRLYKPRQLSSKLPILLYFHGGGFCLGSRTWPNFHAACRHLSGELPAIVLSVDYRLAPEHRLPAAIHDAATALLWLRSQTIAGPETCDPWLAEHGDFSRVFVSGESAGGNMTHHMAVQFGPNGLNPVQIRGFVLIMPALIGKEVTQSELDCPPGVFLNREMIERYSRLALPAGADRDHPALNPFGPDSPSLEGVETGCMLVVAAEKDILIDRNLDYVKRMKEMGKNVEIVVIPGEGHAFFSLKPFSVPTVEVIRTVGRFMDRTGGGSD